MCAEHTTTTLSARSRSSLRGGGDGGSAKKGVGVGVVDPISSKPAPSSYATAPPPPLHVLRRERELSLLRCCSHSFLLSLSIRRRAWTTAAAERRGLLRLGFLRRRPESALQPLGTTLLLLLLPLIHENGVIWRRSIDGPAAVATLKFVFWPLFCPSRGNVLDATLLQHQRKEEGHRVLGEKWGGQRPTKVSSSPVLSSFWGRIRNSFIAVRV